MEKTKTFMTEKKRDKAKRWYVEHGFWVHPYRYVTAFGFVYCFNYWK